VDAPEGFGAFVTERSPALVRSAWLLTGDQASAQDLVQTALAKTWVRWDRVVRQEAPEGYVRRVMVTTYLSWRRRRWHGELPTEAMPERAVEGDPYGEAELRATVRAALDELPRRQRAVVVLRYFDDLTEAQTAHALGCSVGTVKSQAAKALAKLRASAHLSAIWGEEVSHDQS